MQHHTYGPRALSSLSSVAVFLVSRFGLVIGARWGIFGTLYLGEGENSSEVLTSFEFPHRLPRVVGLISSVSRPGLTTSPVIHVIVTAPRRWKHA